MANRTNLALEVAADTADAANGTAAPAKGGGLKAFLPMILTVVFMPVLAWAMTMFVLVPRLQKSLGLTPPGHEEKAEAGAPEKASAEGEPAGKTGSKESAGAKETVTMTKLLVNVSGTMGSRYLLTSLTLAGNGAEFKSTVAKNEARLRDAACTILATKTISDLEKPGARNLVRSELLNGFNNILGANSVSEMYITELAIQ